MYCFECYEEMDSPREGHYEECPNCGYEHYCCCQCGNITPDLMKYDEDCGYICDSCIEDNEEFFLLNEDDMQDTDYSWGM